MFDILTNNLFAHRGYFNNEKGIPENSMPAFRKALIYGYNIELDVHITKDNKVVVFHDTNLKRVCGVNKIIENLTYEEILKYNLFNTSYKIPLLSDVLKLVNGKVVLLIETKTIKFNGRLEKQLSKLLDNYNGSFAIQSFNHYSIYWFKKNRKNYIRGIISTNPFKVGINIFDTILYNIILKVNFISYNLKLLPNSYISSIRKKLPVIGWTIKDEKNYNKALKYCDNEICEHMNMYINK